MHSVNISFRGPRNDVLKVYVMPTSFPFFLPDEQCIGMISAFLDSATNLEFLG